MDRASALAHNAAQQYMLSHLGLTVSETLELTSGERKVVFPGHIIRSGGRGFASRIDSLVYIFRISTNYRDDTPPPIGEVTIRLGDISRLVTVSGSDDDQVDALAASVSQSLSDITSIVGGEGAQLLFSMLIPMAIVFVVISCIYWIAHRKAPERAIAVKIVFASSMVLACMALMVISGLTRGFAMYSTSGDFTVRNSGLITIFGLFIGAVGLFPLFFRR